MMTDLLLSIAHHLIAFGLVAVVAMQWILLRDPPDHPTVQRLARLNVSVIILTVIVLVVGALRAIYGLKGWAFLAHNPLFHTKVTLFLIVMLIMVVPTLRFAQWRRATANPAWSLPSTQWKTVRRCLVAEFHLLLIIPILAALMARGLGLPAT